MGWFSKILVQKTNTGELVDITDLDQEHYESFLAAMEQLRIAYKVAVERKQKESTSEGNCIKPDVIKSVCGKKDCNEPVYEFGLCFKHYCISIE